MEAHLRPCILNTISFCVFNVFTNPKDNSLILASLQQLPGKPQTVLLFLLQIQIQIQDHARFTRREVSSFSFLRDFPNQIWSWTAHIIFGFGVALFPRGVWKFVSYGVFPVEDKCFVWNSSVVRPFKNFGWKEAF